MWHGREKCCDSWPVQYVKLTGEEAQFQGEGVEGVDYTPFSKKGGVKSFFCPPPFSADKPTNLLHNLFSIRYKTNCLVKSAYSLFSGEERIYEF